MFTKVDSGFTLFVSLETHALSMYAQYVHTSIVFFWSDTQDKSEMSFVVRHAPPFRDEISRSMAIQPIGRISSLDLILDPFSGRALHTALDRMGLLRTGQRRAHVVWAVPFGLFRAAAVPGFEAAEVLRFRLRGEAAFALVRCSFIHAKRRPKPRPSTRTPFSAGCR
jgi:hypothetical protein